MAALGKLDRNASVNKMGQIARRNFISKDVDFDDDEFDADDAGTMQ